MPFHLGHNRSAFIFSLLLRALKAWGAYSTEQVTYSLDDVQVSYYLRRSPSFITLLFFSSVTVEQSIMGLNIPLSCATRLSQSRKKSWSGASRTICAFSSHKKSVRKRLPTGLFKQVFRENADILSTSNTQSQAALKPSMTNSWMPFAWHENVLMISLGFRLVSRLGWVFISLALAHLLDW